MSKSQGGRWPESSKVWMARPQIRPSLCPSTPPPNDGQSLQAQKPVDIIEPAPIHINVQTTSSQPAEKQIRENIPSVTRRSDREISHIPAVQYSLPPNVFIDNRYKREIPRIPKTSPLFSPVHIDVGGSNYTTSLETLTMFPYSRLGRMFSGSIPLMLDRSKQHFFIDRDGIMFRHILNYLRNRRLILPDNFADYDLLIVEADYFGLHQMVVDLINRKTDLKRNIEEQ